MYYVYLCKCLDGSFYCGYTRRPSSRFNEHSKGTGARYTQSHGVIEMRVISTHQTLRSATQAERRTKYLTHEKKEQLFNNGARVNIS